MLRVDGVPVVLLLLLLGVSCLCVLRFLVRVLVLAPVAFVINFATCEYAAALLWLSWLTGYAKMVQAPARVPYAPRFADFGSQSRRPLTFPTSHITRGCKHSHPEYHERRRKHDNSRPLQVHRFPV